MPETIRIDAIDASGRLRPIDSDHAAFIASSIEQKGIIEPLIVRPAGERYKLTAGGHRLAAVKLLGWTELVVGPQVLIRDEDEIEARVSEIDENLVRPDLNALDRALFLAERRRLYDEKNGANSHGGDRKSNKFKEETKSQTLRLGFSARFSEQVADRVGLSERAVQLALRIAASLDREALDALRGTRVERNQQELLALIELTADQQRAAAKEIASGAAKNVREARVAIGVDEAAINDPQARCWATLLAAWEKANAKTRRAFLKEIGAEIVKKG